MAHIFISYSHKDRIYAHELAAVLKKKGLEPWIDDRIDYGTSWPQVIEEKLKECGALVVIMTPRSYESDWVQNELAFAKSKKKPIFPLLLEGEVWLSVAATQYVNVSDGKQPPENFFESVAQVVTGSVAKSPLSNVVFINAGEGTKIAGARFFGNVKPLGQPSQQPQKPEAEDETDLLNRQASKIVKALREYRSSLSTNQKLIVGKIDIVFLYSRAVARDLKAGKAVILGYLTVDTNKYQGNSYVGKKYIGFFLQYHLLSSIKPILPSGWIKVRDQNKYAGYEKEWPEETDLPDIAVELIEVNKMLGVQLKSISITMKPV